MKKFKYKKFLLELIGSSDKQMKFSATDSIETITLTSIEDFRKKPNIFSKDYRFYAIKPDGKTVELDTISKYVMDKSTQAREKILELIGKYS